MSDRQERTVVDGRRFRLVVLAALLLAAPAFAFDSKGHVVIEALAYRTLAEGHDGQPPRPDVLRDLINDGALDAVLLRARRHAAEAVRGRARFEPAPGLAAAPDRPSGRGLPAPVQRSGTVLSLHGDARRRPDGPAARDAIPRALAENAVVRCNDLLDELIREIVLEGGPARAGAARPVRAHARRGRLVLRIACRADRRREDRIPAGLAADRTDRPSSHGALERIPVAAYHKWDDHRDKTYVIEGEPARCEKRTDHPYDVPYECLSPEGDARAARSPISSSSRDLRAAQLAAPKGTYTGRSARMSGAQYKAKWFTASHPCEGASCAERQPPDPPPGAYVLPRPRHVLEPDAQLRRHLRARHAVEVRLGPEPVPLWAERNVGYRHYTDGAAPASSGSVSTSCCRSGIA